jgi:hypothetical protein
MKKAEIVLLAIATAIVYLYALTSFASDTSELSTSLIYFGFIVVIWGLVAFYVGKGSLLLSASLLVFALEFFVFAWRAISGNQDSEHITAVLQGNPILISNSYIQELVRNAVWYGILPTALGIGLYIASFVARRKALIGWFRNVLLLIAGGFILYLGTSVFQFTQEYINGAGGDYIANSFRTIYLPLEWLGILWIVAGILLMITSVPYLARTLAQLVARELRSNSLSTNAEKVARTYD